MEEKDISFIKPQSLTFCNAGTIGIGSLRFKAYFSQEFFIILSINKDLFQRINNVKYMSEQKTRYS